MSSRTDSLSSFGLKPSCVIRFRASVNSFSRSLGNSAISNDFFLASSIEFLRPPLQPGAEPTSDDLEITLSMTVAHVDSECG